MYNSSTVGILPRFGVTGAASVGGQPSGHAKVNFFGKVPEKANYLIMDTDYDTYSLVYSCNPQMVPMFWILSRTPTLDQTLLDSLNEKARAMLPNYDWSSAIKDV